MTPATRWQCAAARTAVVLLLLAAPLHSRSRAPAAAASSSGPDIDRNRAAAVRITGLDAEGEAAGRKLIADQLERIEKRGLTRPRADDAAYFLERGLRRIGYRDAEVLWRIDPDGRTLRLTVENAVPRALGNLTFPGAPVADTATLEDLARAATLGREHGLLPGKIPFVEEDIEKGVEAIADHYLNRGFWDAAVGPVDFRERADGRDVVVDVVIAVETGPLFHVGAITFDGELALDAKRLAETVAPYTGRPATMETLLEMRKEVATVYQGAGFYRAIVSLLPEPARDARLDLAFSIDAGGAFTVGAVEISGEEKLNPSFLEKRFAPLVGRPYRVEAVDRVQRELIGLRLFDDISIVPEEMDEETVRLLVEIDEAKSKEVGLYGGYGSFDGVILGLSLRERNLFGTGRLLGLDAETTGRGERFEFKYLDKWFLDSFWSLDARLFALTKDLEGYDKSEYGFRAEFTRQLTPAYAISFFATPSYVDIAEAGIPAAELGDQQYFVNSIGMTHTFDRRDSPVLPSHGFIAEGTVDYASAAVASEIDFLRASARFSWYRSIGKKHILSLGARSGVIVATEDTDEIPIDLRFFSGGSTSVRSFLERRMPPRASNGDALGGEFFNTFNAELTRTLTGAVRGAVFFDAGNLGEEVGSFGFGEMHYAGGLGLRVDLPFGPLRADYGWNLNRRETEPVGAFHITVGIAF